MKLVPFAVAGALLASPLAHAHVHPNAGDVKYVTVREPPVTVYKDNPKPVTLTAVAMEVVTQTYVPTEVMPTYSSYAPTQSQIAPTSYTPEPTQTTAPVSTTASTSSSSSQKSSSSKMCTTLNLPITTTIDGQSTSFMSEVSTCVNPGTKFKPDENDDEDDESSALPILMSAVAFVPAILAALF